MMSHESQVKSLEQLVINETEKLKTLRQIVDKNNKEKETTKKNIMKNTRDAKSYRDSLKNSTHEEFKEQLDELSAIKKAVSIKRDQLVQLKNSLKEFEGLEPTDEAIRAKVEDMKKSRLSLEMSFLDS